MVNVIRIICEWVRIIIKLSRPAGVKSLACENITLRQQLMILSRQRKRSPRLKASDRVLLGLLGNWIRPKRLAKVAILIKPATILKFHRALVKRKYRLLFSNKTPKKSGRKGPSTELIKLIIEMKKRNPRFGYLRINMQIQHAFGIVLDKGVVKRVLDKHHQPTEPFMMAPLG